MTDEEIKLKTQVLAFIRKNVELPNAKSVFSVRDLCDARILWDLSRHVLCGMPLLPSQGERLGRPTPEECIREVVDGILEEYGVSSFAVQHWPDRCAARLQADGLDINQQQSILNGRHQAGEGSTERSKLVSAGEIGAWGEDRFELMALQQACASARRSTKQSKNCSDSLAEVGNKNPMRNSRAKLIEEGTVATGGTSGKGPEVHTLDEIMWIASILVFMISGTTPLPSGSDLRYMGKKALRRKHAARAMVDAWIENMPLQEQARVYAAVRLLQASCRRSIASLISPLALSKRERAFAPGQILPHTPQGWSPERAVWSAAQRLVPPNTPNVLPSFPLQVGTGQTQQTSPPPGAALTLASINAPPQGPYIPMPLRAPWNEATCLSVRDNFVVMASGSVMGIFQVTAHQQQPLHGQPHTNSHEYILQALGTASMVRCLLELQRGYAEVTCVDCALHWRLIRSTHLRAATPGLSRLSSRIPDSMARVCSHVDLFYVRFATAPGSYDQASRNALGTPVLGRFKVSSHEDDKESGVVAVGDAVGHILVLRPHSGTLVWELEGEGGRVQHVRLLQGGALLASLHQDGTFFLWDLAFGVPFFKAEVLTREAIGLVEAGDWVILAFKGAFSVDAWNVQSLRQSNNVNEGDGFKRILFQQEEITCMCACYTAEHVCVSTGGRDGVLRIWTDIAVDHPILLFGHTKPILSVCCWQHRVVTGGADDTARVWDIKDLRCTKVLLGHKSEVSSVFCDSHKVVTGSKDGEVRVWLATGACAYSLPTQGTGAVNELSLIVQKSSILSLLTRTNDGTLTFWLPLAASPNSQEDALPQPSSKSTKSAKSPSKERSANTSKKSSTPADTRASIVRTLYGAHAAHRSPSPGRKMVASFGGGHVDAEGAQVLSKSAPSKFRWFGSRAPRVTQVCPGLQPLKLGTDDQQLQAPSSRSPEGMMRKGELREHRRSHSHMELHHDHHQRHGQRQQRVPLDLSLSPQRKRPSDVVTRENHLQDAYWGNEHAHVQMHRHEEIETESSRVIAEKREHVSIANDEGNALGPIGSASDVEPVYAMQHDSVDAQQHIAGSVSRGTIHRLEEAQPGAHREAEHNWQGRHSEDVNDALLPVFQGMSPTKDDQMVRDRRKARAWYSDPRPFAKSRMQETMLPHVTPGVFSVVGAKPTLWQNEAYMVKSQRGAHKVDREAARRAAMQRQILELEGQLGVLNQARPEDVLHDGLHNH